MDGSTVLKSVTLPYGSTPDFGSTDPVKSGVDDPEEYVFTGWEPAIGTVVGAQDYIAQFNFTGSILRKLLTGNSFKLDNSEIQFVRANAMPYNANVTDVYLPNAISIGNAAFSTKYGIKSVYLPLATVISDLSFRECTALKTVTLPSAVTIGSWAFYRCYALTSVSLPVATTIASDAFSSDSKLTDIYVSFASDSSSATGAPWGATNATVHYNTVFDENGEPVLD